MRSWPYRKVLFLTCLSFFLVEALPQLADAFVHESHFHVALVKKLLLLLQLAVLFLIQLVSDLWINRLTSTTIDTPLGSILQWINQ